MKLSNYCDSPSDTMASQDSSTPKSYGGLLQSAFRTPEPFATYDDTQPPSPPRQPRLRVKRRLGSNLSAPTHQFLASVAAADARSADVPIPSIEEPDFTQEDAEMNPLSRPEPPEFDEMALAPQRGRMFSPPKTPAPGMAPSLSPRRYPDWSVDSSSSRESSPEYESSRPSTARSTLTNTSIFSRLSCLSDDNQFVSPEQEAREHKPATVDRDEDEAPAAKRRATGRKAPWTRAMSNHLWSIYVAYLQDPTKTPVRMGKSCIPPQGVCSRVAREAKRTWKGAKTFSKPISVEDKSGSTTPKAESSSTFMQWPHSTASTRAHLRELCKSQASSSGIRTRHFLSKSPTPFYRPSVRNNRTPARSPSVFSSHELNKNLILSTSESMKPTGPLAQLTKSAAEAAPEPESSVASTPTESSPSVPLPTLEFSLLDRPAFAAPFGANSYGPSSSASLASIATPTVQKQPNTVGHRRNTLQSPVRISRPSTQQRRRVKHLSMDARRRPLLPHDIFQDPLPTAGLAEGFKRTTEFSSADSGRLDDPFIPRTAGQSDVTTPVRATRRARGHTMWTAAPASAGLAPPIEPLARLGSPFSASNSHSVPNRFSLPNEANTNVVRRPFATVQQTPDASNSSHPPRNLANRLAYIDQRLREFNNRENSHRLADSTE